MPPQSGKSAILSKLGQNVAKAFEENKNNEIEWGRVDLPPNINGIAQLTDCKFDLYKTGEFVGKPFFMAAGIVIAPKEHEGIPVEGLRTQVGPIPLCDTPKRSTKKSVNDHVADVINELKKLDETCITPETKLADLEAIVKDLAERQPYFRFRTWKGEPTKDYPNPRVNHDWQGHVDYSPDDAQDAQHHTQDNTGAGADPTTSQSGTTSSGDTEDLDALATTANNMDEDAMKHLAELAMNAGVTEEEINDAKNWDEVVAKMRELVGGSSEPAKAESNGAIKKGDVVTFFPIDPKTKKAGKKSVQYNVETSDPKRRICTLKNLDNPRLSYAGVKWDEVTANG